MSDSYRILRKLRLATWGTRYFPTIGFFFFCPLLSPFSMPILVQFLPFFWLFYLTILFQRFPVFYFAFLFPDFHTQGWYFFLSFLFTPFSFLSFLLMNSLTHLFILFIFYLFFVCVKFNCSVYCSTDFHKTLDVILRIRKELCMTEVFPTCVVSTTKGQCLPTSSPSKCHPPQVCSGVPSTRSSLPPKSCSYFLPSTLYCSKNAPSSAEHHEYNTVECHGLLEKVEDMAETTITSPKSC